MTCAYARTVLDVAAEVEAAETNIKHAILAAAQAGDCARVAEIVTRWLDTPPTQLLASMGLAPCGEPEVAQTEHPGGGGGRV